MKNTLASIVHLRFALRDGFVVHVKSFEHLRGTRMRPRNLWCPECDKQVTVRLPEDGKIKDHFAHYPDSDCILRSGGEAAHHANAKYFMASLFRKTERVLLTFKCRACQRHKSYLEIMDYDDVAIEKAVGKRCPDVSCLRKGITVGAVEVFNKHAVSQHKIYDLDQSGVAWFEIPVSQVRPSLFNYGIEVGAVGLDANVMDIRYPKPPAVCYICEQDIRRQPLEIRRKYGLDESPLPVRKQQEQKSEIIILNTKYREGTLGGYLLEHGWLPVESGEENPLWIPGDYKQFPNGLAPKCMKASDAWELVMEKMKRTKLKWEV